jgi:hypothetical protein
VDAARKLRIGVPVIIVEHHIRPLRLAEKLETQVTSVTRRPKGKEYGKWKKSCGRSKVTQEHRERNVIQITKNTFR